MCGLDKKQLVDVVLSLTAADLKYANKDYQEWQLSNIMDGFNREDL